MTTFTIPGAPVGKGRAKVSTFGGFARAYTPEKTASYENLVKLCFKGNQITTAVRMSITAYYPIPKSMPKKRQLEALKGDITPTVKPDIDNVIKIICDALNKIAYKDDNQIVQLFAYKFYSDKPRVVVQIEEL